MRWAGRPGVNQRMDEVLGAGTGAQLRALATKVAAPEFLAAMAPPDKA